MVRARVAWLYSLASSTAALSSNLGIVTRLIGATLDVAQSSLQSV
jgi:hypothetical protein